MDSRPEGPSSVPARYWRTLDDGRIECQLCPRYCRLHEGQSGLCFVRSMQDGALVMTSYGRSSGFCIDPIEKKPLNHFLPGTPVLSFGTAGCNLACKFCQNWDISKAREAHRLASQARPEALAQTALDRGCRSIAYTYNDPVIFLEYAVDVAQASRELGIKSVAVSAGYICDEPRAEFFSRMDAVNIDLKAFTEKFYKTLCGGQLQAVLETLEYIHQDSDCWLEITTLLIPGENDSPAELELLTQWVAEHLGADVPLHFSAFHPDWKMRDKQPTSASSLFQARDIARAAGLNYVYTGNINDTDGGSTYCPACGTRVIERDWYRLGQWQLKGGACANCGSAIAGVFEDLPGNWGRRRQAVVIDH